MAIEVPSEDIIREAVLTLMSSLPPQTQMRFYWNDEGRQCFEFLDANSLLRRRTRSFAGSTGWRCS